MEDTLKNQKEKIVKLLTEKSVMKQDVFKNTLHTFDLLKECITEISNTLISEVKEIDKRISVEVLGTSSYTSQLKVAGDMLEFLPMCLNSINLIPCLKQIISNKMSTIRIVGSSMFIIS